ncbi:hypothetical protein [Streptomyces virginiae]|uniref:hypothetical protein n=1 Tax=Streptomyces virginiae TaxID=1961 RepID=UPI002E2B1260|nr:hypothetical protein [Streptomyces virginiae]
MSEPFDDGSEGLPCVLSEDVTAYMTDPALPPWTMGPVVAAMVEIGETRGLVAGSTVAEDWPECWLLPLGEDGALGIIEYVIAKDAAPPQVIVTRVLLY